MRIHINSNGFIELIIFTAIFLHLMIKTPVPIPVC